VVFEKAGAKESLFQLLGRCGLLALLGPGEHAGEIAGKLATLHIPTFIVSSPGAEASGGENLKDIFGDFARLYGAQGPFLYLIRPDGHVGLFQRRMERRSLAAYLEKIRAPDAVEKSFAS
jgi:hypothetical protein